MKYAMSFALALAGFPAAAQAQSTFSEKHGGWEVTGEDGDCAAGLMNDTGLLMFVSPATSGENQGGMMISKLDLVLPNGGEAELEVVDKGAAGGTFRLDIVGEDSLYWRAFPTATTVDGFSDGFRIRVTHGDKMLIDMPVAGFAAARAAMHRCVEKTKKA